MSITDTRLLSPRETAEALNVSVRTVYRLVQSGQLAAVQLGGPRASLRIDEGELRAWLAADPEPDWEVESAQG